MSFIIGLAGRKQSGKDSACNYLSNVFGFDFYVKKYAFADKLKEFLRDCMNVPDYLLWGTDTEKNVLIQHILWENLPHYNTLIKEYQEKGIMVPTGPMSVREILQQFGTNIMRRMYDNIWLYACMTQIAKDKPDIALISDCRFPNELDGIFERGGIVVRLTRNVKKDCHESENALDNYRKGYVLDNQMITMERSFYLLSNIVRNELIQRNMIGNV